MLDAIIAHIDRNIGFILDGITTDNAERWIDLGGTLVVVYFVVSLSYLGWFKRKHVALRWTLLILLAFVLLVVKSIIMISLGLTQ